MTRPASPHVEIEVLAAQNRRTMAIGTPRGWATLAKANDVLIEAAIETATEFAARAYLACLGTTPIKADTAITSIISDMMGQAHAVADALDATPKQRHRLVIGRAALFDLRLAELQSTAVLPWGVA